MSAAMASSDAACHLKFQNVPGFFFDYADWGRQNLAVKATTLPNFGLLETNIPSAAGSTEWDRFTEYVKYVNDRDSSSAQYKVLFLTRHGLGVHNLFESKVGNQEWNTYWSHLDGDGSIVWADAKLVEDGMRQAEELGRTWSDAVTNRKLPLPGTLYTSPLARCLETTKLVFEKTFRKQGVEFRPVIKELLRERLTDHTCDRRSSRSWIEANYPGYVIESSFSEEDSLWKADRFETANEHAARKQQVLEEIFNTDENTFISLTTHSYAISAILQTVGLYQFRVREGSTVALFVKAERIHPRTVAISRTSGAVK